MRRFIMLTLCLSAAGATMAAGDCVKQEKEYYGSLYYNECHCATISYPDVAKAFEPLGVKAEPRWVACSEFDGGKWCVCGVSLSWKEQPKDRDVCETNRKEVQKLIEKLTSTKENFGVSAPLICPR